MQFVAHDFTFDTRTNEITRHAPVTGEALTVARLSHSAASALTFVALELKAAMYRDDLRTRFASELAMAHVFESYSDLYLAHPLGLTPASREMQAWEKRDRDELDATGEAAGASGEKRNESRRVPSPAETLARHLDPMSASGKKRFAHRLMATMIAAGDADVPADMRESYTSDPAFRQDIDALAAGDDPAFADRLGEALASGLDSDDASQADGVTSPDSKEVGG